MSNIDFSKAIYEEGPYQLFVRRKSMQEYDGTYTGKGYSIYNKDTDTEEFQAPNLPYAINVIKQLNNDLKKVTEPPDVIPLIQG